MGEIEVLVAAHAEDHRRHDLVVHAGKDDRVLRRGMRKLDRHERHRVDVACERVVGTDLDAGVAMAGRRDGHRRLVDQKLGCHGSLP